jgi:hypothetical protein
LLGSTEELTTETSSHLHSPETQLILNAMGAVVATTTTEATIGSISESLAKLNMTLGRIAAR